MKKNNYENICSEVDVNSIESYVPMAPDIVQTTSFHFSNYEEFIDYSSDEKNHFVYTRGSNPTIKSLENKLAELEHGEKCKVFSSGMGAISATLFTLLQAGDHLLMINTIYGEAVSFGKYLSKYGVICDRVDVDSTEEISKYIKPETKMIYFESPSSQKFEMLDLDKVVSIAKKNNIYTAIDATWASPIFQSPLDHGIDVVIHSLSKYLGGHSDSVGGCVIGKEKIVNDIFEHGHQALGSVISPFNAWLTIRGLRTLPVRMKQFDSSIRYVLDAIKDDERIEKIYHPYVSTGEQKKIADKYLTGYGSLFGLDFKDKNFDKLKIFVNSLKVVSIGVSWGGFESLALPSFKGNNEANLKERGLPISHVRLYVGLENPETIVEDLKQAMDRAYKK
ncbi:cystathionine beta-lyase [Companilactobacillus paralimentarius DSM 13238 = JCM 10415]|uniref:homocysteine desulfhydrase n=2 Tax=Companilactobacillus paralimentarius TaxID=83526 RepID=A0A0R1PIT0_9LACO|nr:aminotransferase class I/II-fold pyridoxal phosphate-dependent enzyme [Companilactobacillus paralimentarius]KAE9565226.1 cystathionine gamma-synthase [Companilactobacillus paralimentarius]KRL30436.1 cystathionine beta-lyase [Companilactobacillus paralimentarius DSM 13238 = JCM 10415]